MAVATIFLAWRPEPSRGPTPPRSEQLAAFAEPTAIPVAKEVQPVWTLPEHQVTDPVPTSAPQVAPPPPPPPPSTTSTTTAPEPTTAPPSPATVAPTTTEPEPTTTTTEPEPEAPVLGGRWEKLRQCESGGNYATRTGNGYAGAYQFDQSTWDGVVRRMGRRDLAGTSPASASVADQDAAAAQLYSERGAQPWPVCGRYL